MNPSKKRKISEAQRSEIVDLTELESDGDQSEDEIQFISHQKRANLPQGKTINDILKDKSTEAGTQAAKSLPPLLLTRPEQVAKHTPCSLHLDILPPELAERLYRRMLSESSTWGRNKWYLNDRQVESPHTTAFYSSDGKHDSAQWYMGRKDHDGESRLFLKEQEEAREIIEKFVNKQLDKRKRHDLEYAGSWRADVAAANCYRGSAETVGAHADHLTYLGPYPTIASLSLGVTRSFRLRAVPSSQAPDEPPPRTYDITLPHNSLCIMGAGCQERFKHSIPPARSIDLFKLKNTDGRVETFVERINITFRFYRPDFAPTTTPVCQCGVPCVLRADAKGKAAAYAATPDQKLRFFWQCTAGAQNEGKRCGFFKILDMDSEGRGPYLGQSTVDTGDKK